MTARSLLSRAIGLGSLTLLCGCASVISGRHADVRFESYPVNAHVVVHDKCGREVASVNTPGVVSLKRNGRYFLPARYTATISAPGYETARVPIRSTMNPWIAGNVVVGGIPGLIVDNATGAAWKPRTEAIHQRLSPLVAAAPPAPPEAPVTHTAAALPAPPAPKQSTPPDAGALPLGIY